MATGRMYTERMDVTYKNKRKRIPRSKNIDELLSLIERQFQLDEDTFSLKGKIDGKEYEIETQDDVDDVMKEAEELVAYPKEEHHNGTAEPPASVQLVTSLYVKHLNEDVDEAELVELFEKFGGILSAKVMRNYKTDPPKSRMFGFVNFERPECAAAAMEAMNDKEIEGKKLFVGPQQPKGQRQEDMKHRFKENYGKNKNNLYIKNLDKSISDNDLHQYFAGFGDIISAKIATDTNRQPKGFGFVCFRTAEDADRAKQEMDGHLLNGKHLYVNFAQSKEERKVENTRVYMGRQLAKSCSNIAELNYIQAQSPQRSSYFQPQSPQRSSSFQPQMPTIRAPLMGRHYNNANPNPRMPAIRHPIIKR